MRKASLLLTHVADAMTRRLFERSTAMMDQVADAVAGRRHAVIRARTKMGLRMARIICPLTQNVGRGWLPISCNAGIALRQGTNMGP